MERTSRTIRTTTTTSTTGGGYGGYKDGGDSYSEQTFSSGPVSGGRTLVISRTLGTGRNLGSSGGTIERSSRVASQYNSGAPIPHYADMTASGVLEVKESREQERKDMQDLNERFANYIDRVGGGDGIGTHQGSV